MNLAVVEPGLHQPAVLPPSEIDTPPTYKSLDDNGGSEMSAMAGGLLPSSQPVMTVADLQRRQAELDARAAQLDQREKQAQQQEAWRVEHGYGTTESKLTSISHHYSIPCISCLKFPLVILAHYLQLYFSCCLDSTLKYTYFLSPVPNWPPFPRWCCLKPYVRIDFISDIPSQCCWMAKFAHYLWIAYSLLLLVNVFGTLSYLIVAPNLTDAGPLFGVSIIIFIFLTPASFFGWNRPLYKAFKYGNSPTLPYFFSPLSKWVKEVARFITIKPQYKRCTNCPVIRRGLLFNESLWSFTPYRPGQAFCAFLLR